MKDRVQQLEAEMSEKGSALASLKSLVESSAWVIYRKNMEQQRTSRLFMVAETQLKNFGETLGQEFMKGEGAGIGLCLMYPYTQIELLQLDIQRLEVAISQENEHVQAVAKSDARSGASRVDSGSSPWHGD